MQAGLVSTDHDSALALIRRLVMDYGLARWRRYALAFVLMAIGAGCTALPAYLISHVINEAYFNRNISAIVMLATATVVLFAVKGFVTYGSTLILARISNSIIAENQRRLFANLLNQNISFFADRHSSEFAQRISAGVNATTQVLNLVITALGRDLLTLGGLVAVMVIQDPFLSFLTLIVFPPAMIFLRKMIRRVRQIAKMQYTGGTRILETMQETLQGIRIVKAFTLEDTMRARFDANVADVEHEANKFARVAGRSSPVMETLGGIAVALAIIYGGYATIVNGATPGAFFSFMTAFLLANEPAKRLARLNLDLNNALIAVRALFEVIDHPPTEAPDDDQPALRITDGRVQFENVEFAYRKAEPILRGMSFTAEPGQTTALVGPSGGGKSTILNLLLRLYEGESGRIVIDGQDIAKVSRRSLRQQIAYVGQDIFLFRGSIRDNIASGKTGATEDEIVAAARAANAHDFITAFPNGYDTPVGEHGLQLSGGQRQRVAVARALIKGAHLILLDEPTAALDPESERQVQDAIAHLMQGRTTIVIAHRLHTVTHADSILVIEEGRVIESGRHEELLRKGSRYASFYRLQLREPDGSTTAVAASA
jgi:ATP-binding cassette subfamily B protein